MTNDEIRQLIQLAQESGVSELEVQRGDARVRIKLGSAHDISFTVPPSLPTAALPAPKLNSTGAPTADPLSDPATLIVKSPIVGTFYEAGAPDSPPFVAVGDVVSVGSVLCIIESMKLMNEIESDHAGMIVAKLVQDGQPVEYGESLFAIRPD